MTDLQQKKFGTIKGVLIPNITMMFGVILFLRLGVLTAHAGSIQMLAVIGLSFVIMVFTSFSIGALATNMHVGKGGIYYIISRTLGVEIGGAVGLALYVAQLISTTLTVAGFGVSFCEFYPQFSLPVVEFVTLTVLALLSGVSASWSLRLQGVILALLLTSIGSVFLGSTEYIEPSSAPVVPFYPGGTLGFWATFAMFYPAMTGIEAGMALSGSLRNPGKSLYRGNLYSLIFVALTYAGLALYAAWKIPHSVLLSDPFAFVEFARWSNLIYFGIWGATLSSALGCLLGAPRMLQSMAEDGIVPSALSKVHGRLEEPRYALLVTYLGVALLLFTTTIDQIIPMLAMICLVSYGLLNLVTAMAELMNTPSWRPRLRTPWWTSLSAVILIIIAMFMTAPGWAFLTVVVLGGAHLLLQSRKLKTSFQDLRNSLIFFVSRLALYRLGKPSEHALTWHPQLLVFVSSPTQQERLIRVSHSLTRRSGILSVAIIVPEEWQPQERLNGIKEWFNKHLERQRIACLSEVYPAPSTVEGYSQLIRAYGIGPIQPNTIVFEIDEEKLDASLIDIVETCQLTQKNLMLIRNQDPSQDHIFNKRRGSRRKHIVIHWDPDETSNFAMTMSLVTTLTDGLIFGGAEVTIRADVADEGAEEPVDEYLLHYLHQSRIQAKTEVSSENQDAEKPAHVCFVSLNPLPVNPSTEDRSTYLEHVKQLFQTHNTAPCTVFITCYDDVDHQAIYLPSLDEQ